MCIYLCTRRWGAGFVEEPGTPYVALNELVARVSISNKRESIIIRLFSQLGRLAFPSGRMDDRFFFNGSVGTFDKTFSCSFGPFF